MQLRFLISIALVHVLSSTAECQTWTTDLPGIGTFSSPRTSDLNRDGVGDIVLGAGRAEFQACDTAIFALDGATGSLLWHASARDQIFGSAALRDINADGISDVFIGGRSAELQAIDGASGKVIWQFRTAQDFRVDTNNLWFNFYNPQFVTDQDGDGIADILVANGGDVLVEAYDENRPPGHLVLVSAATGKLLARAPTPDGHEMYMSSIVLEDHRDGKSLIVFGTGGETIGGSLYAATLPMILQEDLAGAQQLASGVKKGFISPPVLADITQDDILDIVALSVDGRILAFDGLTLKPLWQRQLPNTEAYSSLAVGQFTEDHIPDFFASVANGVWPKLEWNRQAMIDGSSGEIIYTDSLGFYQTSSPIAADLSGNGKDEILLSINYQEFDSLQFKYFRNMLVVTGTDFTEPLQIAELFPGSNISSTPWVGDLDENGKLDIIYVYGTNDRQTYTFDGMNVLRLTTDIPVYGKVQWGAYMGSNGDGIYRVAKIRNP